MKVKELTDRGEKMTTEKDKDAELYDRLYYGSLLDDKREFNPVSIMSEVGKEPKPVPPLVSTLAPLSDAEIELGENLVINEEIKRERLKDGSIMVESKVSTKRETKVVQPPHPPKPFPQPWVDIDEQKDTLEDPIVFRNTYQNIVQPPGDIIFGDTYEFPNPSQTKALKMLGVSGEQLNAPFISAKPSESSLRETKVVQPSRTVEDPLSQAGWVYDLKEEKWEKLKLPPIPPEKPGAWIYDSQEEKWISMGEPTITPRNEFQDMMERNKRSLAESLAKKDMQKPKEEIKMPYTPQDNLHDCKLLKLKREVNELEQVYLDRLAHLRLIHARLVILWASSLDEDNSIYQLSKVSQMNKKSVSPHVETLEGLGYIEKKLLAKPLRQVFSITERGKEALKEGLEIWREVNK